VSNLAGMRVMRDDGSFIHERGERREGKKE
jgi:hypothetical protein